MRKILLIFTLSLSLTAQSFKGIKNNQKTFTPRTPLAKDVGEGFRVEEVTQCRKLPRVESSLRMGEL